MSTVPAVRVAIVGAGPYGLSIAAHLRARGIDHRIFGLPMGSWLEHMPGRMFLKSVGFASNLSDPARRSTLGAYCAADGRDYADDAWPIPIDTFTDYGVWFQRQHAPDVEKTEVTRIEQTGGRFELELGSGERLAARQVVLAVGHVRFASTPKVLAGLPPELGTHTCEHRDLGRFAGQEVVVVGAGQSALESAALLHEAGAGVRVLVRRPLVDWNGEPGEPDRSLLRRMRYPKSGLGTGWRHYAWSNGSRFIHHLPSASRTRMVRVALGPAGAWWLKSRVVGRFPLETRTTVRAARAAGDRVRLELAGPSGERQLEADHVLAGTGYRIDVDRLGFLDPALAARIRRVGRAPLLNAGFESTVPGLFVVGLAAAPSFGPAMRFVYGAEFTAGRVVRRLARAAAGGSGRPAPARLAG
jgi:hypothetical protein